MPHRSPETYVRLLDSKRASSRGLPRQNDEIASKFVSFCCTPPEPKHYTDSETNTADNVALSSQQRAFIAVAVLICLLAAGSGIYLYRLRQPFAPSSEGEVSRILGQLPAGSPAIAYLDVAALRKLHDSPLTAILGLAGTGPQGHDRDYTAFVEGTGFDYTRDLDRAAVAFWPAGAKEAGHAGEGQRPPIIAEGRFDEQKIAAYARVPEKRTMHGAPSIYEVPGDPPVSFKFLSTTRMALASGKNADELLAAPSSPARDPAMQENVDRVAGAPIFALVAVDHLSKDFYANFKNVPQLERLARSVESLTLAGQPQGDRIDLTLDGPSDSLLKDALEVGTLLEISRMGTSMMLAGPKTKRQMTAEQATFLQEVASNLKVTHQDRLVRLQLELTPEMLAEPTSPNAAATTPK